MHTTGLEISTDTSPLIIGESAVITCTSAIVVEKLLWLEDEHVLVNVSSNTSATLMFNPVNDSIHNKTFICRAERMGTVEKHTTINASGKTSFCCLYSLDSSMIIICSLVYSVPTAPLQVGAIINVTISHPQSNPIVGEPYNLSCLYNVLEGFVKHEPTVLWMYPNQTNFTTSSIVFDALHASDSGKYKCRVILTSPVLDMQEEALQIYNLTIQRK